MARGNLKSRSLKKKQNPPQSRCPDAIRTGQIAKPDIMLIAQTCLDNIDGGDEASLDYLDFLINTMSDNIAYAE
jgi:hypothetical protein